MQSADTRMHARTLIDGVQSTAADGFTRTDRQTDAVSRVAHHGSTHRVGGTHRNPIRARHQLAMQ